MPISSVHTELRGRACLVARADWGRGVERHELRYSDRRLVREGAPRFVLSLDWSRDDEHLGEVQTSVTYVDLVRQHVTDARFWSAVAVGLAEALEADVRRGVNRGTRAATAVQLAVNLDQASGRATSEDLLPELVQGTVIYRFEA